jgi:hypothetical protein
MAAKDFILTMAAMGVTLCACVSTRGSVTISAQRLESASATLADDARETAPVADDVSGNYSREARALADQAREFRDTIEDGRRDSRDIDVITSFDELSRRYHTLRDEAEHAAGRRSAADMQRVTEAYLDVERDMGGYRDSRYAQEGVTPDRE